ncbi:hypothetical protein OSTOST_19264 [Ostertagia ostertagi]
MPCLTAAFFWIRAANGWANALLYSCPLERFIDVVYAFSEGALFDNINDARLIDSLNTSETKCLESACTLLRRLRLLRGVTPPTRANV